MVYKLIDMASSQSLGGVARDDCRTRETRVSEAAISTPNTVGQRVSHRLAKLTFMRGDVKLWTFRKTRDVGNEWGRLPRFCISVLARLRSETIKSMATLELGFSMSANSAFWDLLSCVVMNLLQMTQLVLQLGP